MPSEVIKTKRPLARAQAGFGLGCGLGALYTIKLGGEGTFASGLGSAAMFSALVLTSTFVGRSMIATLCRSMINRATQRSEFTQPIHLYIN